MTHSILPAFQAFLLKQQLTLKTIRNYRSDANQFLNWLVQQGVSLLSKDTPFQVNVAHFLTYKTHLQSRNTPLSTLNRHLASLRQFGQFLNLDINLANPPLPFIPTVLKNFKSYLTSARGRSSFGRKNRYKHKTVANYLSDVRHYLTWAESQL